MSESQKDDMLFTSSLMCKKKIFSIAYSKQLDHEVLHQLHLLVFIIHTLLSLLMLMAADKEKIWFNIDINFL